MGLFLSSFSLNSNRANAKNNSIDVGSKRELFVDDYLIDKLDGAEQQLHHPIPREIVMEHDFPWEGNTCYYHTIFRDDTGYRLYYRGSHALLPTTKSSHQVACMAESPDGIHWTKPNLGLVEFNGSRQNNIIWDGIGSNNFVPFKDRKPDCDPQARYKAVGGLKRDGGLYAFKSIDGIQWSLMQDEPIITEGAFDSQNLAFWDPLRKCYHDLYIQRFYPLDRPCLFGIPERSA
jgi:hypothetical protein